MSWNLNNSFVDSVKILSKNNFISANKVEKEEINVHCHVHYHEVGVQILHELTSFDLQKSKYLTSLWRETNFLNTYAEINVVDVTNAKFNIQVYSYLRNVTLAKNH